ncbi:MAG: putative 4-hydroxybenzoate polyprenyltransferase [Acidobacteria bacterium]|nr:putative 4-hydroxybenzoate polyprenyltransferase [Acidobacteriota bacterium]MCZ6878011.1 putative 4-hydroxybenzoate polyprenyltransferase [Acidobacteriota bacterium]
MNKLALLLEAIKFEHTIFALPFAFLGAFLAARGFPGWEISFWIIMAMTGARSAAMAFNRLADRLDDRLNPRTADRALPRELLSPQLVALFTLASSTLFIFSAWMLNDLAFHLSPIALMIILFYSYTKRFTSLSHLVLGLSLAIAPVGGWVAVQGEIQLASFYVAAAVLFWVGGFDIIYACQDYEFDRSFGRHSLPSKVGIKTALQISSWLHVLMMLVLISAFLYFRLSLLSWIGLVLVGMGLTYEHSLVHPEDLSRLNAAFFTLNGLISSVLFVFVGLDLCLFP